MRLGQCSARDGETANAAARAIHSTPGIAARAAQAATMATAWNEARNRIRLFGFITRSPSEPFRHRNPDGAMIPALARECQTVFAGEPDRLLLPLRPMKGVCSPASCRSDGFAGISVHRKSGRAGKAGRTAMLKGMAG